MEGRGLCVCEERRDEEEGTNEAVLIQRRARVEQRSSQ